MGEFDTQTKHNLRRFVLAAWVTFGCIAVLQLMPMPWFFLVLIAMHGGIALYIVSKRGFKKQDFDVARFYRVQYLLLPPYILVMLYSFAVKANIVPLFADEKLAFVLLYTTVCALVTIWNYIRLERSIYQQHLNKETAFLSE